MDTNTVMPPPPAIDREWWVVSTAIVDVVLIVHCRKTGATGVVRDPTADEWRAAFYAPSEPYRWHDDWRVEVLRPRTPAG